MIIRSLEESDIFKRTEIAKLEIKTQQGEILLS